MKRNKPDTAPHSPEAERSVLGCIFLDNSSFYDADRLRVDDFYTSSHQAIYRAMIELSEDHRPIDFITVCEVLSKQGLLQTCGGDSYVSNLTDGLPRVKNIKSYIKIVIDKSRRRKIIALATGLIEDAQQEAQEIEDLISDTDRKLLNIETGNNSGPQRIGDILPIVDRKAAEQWSISSDKSSIGYRTGLEKLDEFTTGFREREVFIVSGWTSDGKSVIMKQSLLAQACDNVPALVFSREISKEQLTDDLKSFISDIHPNSARDKRKMDMFERDAYHKANDIMRHWPIWIDDDRGLHIDELVHRARRIIRTEGIKIVYIDYIQLIKGSGGNPTERMEDVCEGIWHLADSEHVALVPLAQISRDKDKIKRRPRLQDLKGASRMEQDAHGVVFVFRPENDNGKLTKNDELIIAKQRHGGKGILHVEFNSDKLIFEDRNVKYE